MKKYLSLFLSIFFTVFMISGCGNKKVDDMESYVSTIDSISVNDDVKIVGLGEATHGNHEFQNLKLDVFKSLVKNNNCRVFAIEGDFGGCAKVNEYIMGKEGSAKEAAKEIGFGIYRTQEIEDLIEWMRDYNKDAKEDEKLKFYGFDMQRFDNNKEFLFSYLDTADKNLSDEYKDLLKDLNDDNGYDIEESVLNDGEKYIEDLMQKMNENKDKYTKKTSEKEFAFAFQCAQSIKENITLRTSSNDYNNLRDGYMKDKVDWIYNYEDQKLIFINGHNGHIEKTSASIGIKKCMGQGLYETYKDAYYAIGTDFIENKFNVVTSSGKDEVIDLKNADELSSQFSDLSDNINFMDIKKAEENKELKDILNSKIGMNNIGAEFNTWQKISSAFYTIKITPSKSYDGIIVVKTATPSTHVN